MSFKKKYEELVQLLCTATVAGDDQMVIHLSHDDLDGYGCTIVKYFYDQYVNKNRAASRIWTLNTNLINTKVYIPIKRMAAIATNAFPNKRVYFLITDIGGIDLDKLVEQYANSNIHFIIVDHHKTIYHTDNPHTLHYNIHRENGCTIVNCTSKKVAVSALFVDSSCSATKALNDLLVKGFSDIIEDKRLIKNITEFSEAVSLYDTGNVGNWYIDKDSQSMDDVSKQAMLNAMWARYNHRAKKYDAENYTRYQIMNDFSERLHKAIISYVPTSKFTKSRVSFSAIDVHNMWEYLYETSRKYDNIMKSFTPVLREGDKFILADGVVMNIPEGLDAIKKVRVYVHNDNTKPYPALTLFSNRYLSIHYDVDALIVVNMFTKTVDTRSYKDGIDMYTICKHNGGGGHYHAAGFPIP